MHAPAIFIEPNDGCLTMARLLVRRGVGAYGLGNHRGSYVLRSRAFRGTVLAPIANDPRPWLERLDGFAGSAGVLISGSDAATELLESKRAEIPRPLRSFEGEGSAHMAVMDKASLYRLAAAAGVRTPWVHRLRSRAELSAIAPLVSYPCIVKPALSHEGKRAGAFVTTRVADAQALSAYAGAALAAGVELLVTELVPGPEENLEGAVTVRRRDGSYALAYGRHKLRQHPYGTGVGSLLESAEVPETMALARRLLDHAGFHGLSSLEAKRHAVTGERVLIEVNVRAPANFGLGEACGVEAAWRTYATLAGIALGPQRPQVNGRKVVIPYTDALAAAALLKRGELSLPGLVSSYRGTRSAGVLDPRDPAPALAIARRLVASRAAKRGGGRVSRRSSVLRAVRSLAREAATRPSAAHAAGEPATLHLTMSSWRDRSTPVPAPVEAVPAAQRTGRFLRDVSRELARDSSAA